MAVSSVTCWNIKLDFLFFFSLFSLFSSSSSFLFLFLFFLFQVGAHKYEKFTKPFDIEGNLKWDETYKKVKFDPPSQSLVLTWLLYLRETRTLSYGTIDGFLSGLSSTNGQYAGTSIDWKKIGDLMKQWEEQDKQNGRTKQVPTFDMVKDLPLLFIACFKIHGWEYIDCVIMWTAFLIMLSVIGCSACMSKYCPLIEDIEFPDSPGGYDTDRLPKKVHIPWRNWKSRKNHVGEKYFIMIGRNYMDS
jgi:hypothetical protein